jgi:hypothetical protein
LGFQDQKQKCYFQTLSITPSIAESCSGDEITITVSGVPQTALDFELANPTLTKVLSDYTDKEGRLSSYFVDPVSRSFSDAEDLLPTYGIGASMYQINDLDEHEAVFNAIQAAGLAGVPLWLGLKQFPASNPNQTFDGGWYWLDGREFDATWNLWENGEPNDYEFDADCNGTGPDTDGKDDGTEDYGHFNNTGNKLLNDYPDCPDAPSRPVYEFRGNTTVNWYYEDPSNPGTFIDIPINASTLTLNPEVTTTYFIDVITNGIVCSTSYTHVVNPNPTANTIQDYVFCDDDLDGDANNGSILLEESNFEVLKPSILGNDQSINDFKVSFHLSEEDAQNNKAITFPFTSPKKDPDKLHWESQTTEIFVRIENNLTGCINTASSFNLVVNPLPITFEVKDIILCDDNRDGIIDGFDLNSRTNELRSGNNISDPNDIDNQSPDNFPITYHLSIDAANDVNNSGLTSPYKSGNDIIYYRIEHIDNDGALICFKTGEAFELIVEPLPFANEVSILRQCDGDDPLDTDSQDGKFPFDVSGIQEKLIDGQTNITTYYFDENDVFIGNILPDIFETASQTITITVENNSDLKCSDSTTLEFIVDDSPELYEVIVPSQCDDGVSDIDGYSEFDTSLITQTLLTNPVSSQIQSLTDFSVSYTYVDEDGNTQVTNELPNPFNTQTQNVSVTVLNNNNNNCIISDEIKFVVTPLPIIDENLIKIEQCDDGKGSENDGVTLHNLTESQSLFSDNYENEVFEYYKDSDLTQKIENPTAFYNDPLYDEVWVKIINENGCERISKNQDGIERLKIEITVGASEISETFIEDNNTLYSVCEDSDALSQDGLSLFSSSVLQEINTKLISSNPKFADQNIKVTLHRNSTDGLTGENPINLNEDFTSSTPYTQEIWARIVNIDISEFTCLGYAKVGELYVEPKPIANPVTIEKQCDGDSPLDLDSQDGIYPFDVSLIEQQVINGQVRDFSNLLQ